MNIACIHFKRMRCMYARCIVYTLDCIIFSGHEESSLRCEWEPVYVHPDPKKISVHKEFFLFEIERIHWLRADFSTWYWKKIEHIFFKSMANGHGMQSEMKLKQLKSLLALCHSTNILRHQYFRKSKCPNDIRWFG